jgi:hypothetical protein
MPFVPEALPDPFAGLDREGLRAFATAQLNKGGLSRAEVILLDRDGVRAVLKDFGSRGFLTRLWGRFLTAREERAYRALAGLRSVPRLLRRVGPATLLVEWRDASPLHRPLGPTLDERFFDELEATVAGFHARGVVHLDLRKKRNVLVDRDGHPVLVDFASALTRRRFSPWRLAAPLLRSIDRAAVLKHRRRLKPATLSRRERGTDRIVHMLSGIWNTLFLRF